MAAHPTCLRQGRVVMVADLDARERRLERPFPWPLVH
jgi:hypothetical protein